jgi:hypothetical protein
MRHHGVDAERESVETLESPDSRKWHFQGLLYQLSLKQGTGNPGIGESGNRGIR